MRLFLPARPPFSLPAVVRSHGWVQLAPFVLDDGGLLSRVERLASGQVVEMVVNEAHGGVAVEVDGLLTPAEVRALALTELELHPGSIVWDDWDQQRLTLIYEQQPVGSPDSMPERMVGWRKMMYAMVRNVVAPAPISTRTELPFSWILKSLSSMPGLLRVSGAGSIPQVPPEYEVFLER